MASGPCAALLDRVGGDEQIFTELCDAFLEDVPQRLDMIRRALVAGDARMLQREAHTLKGAAGAFDALDVVTVARQLEQLGTAGDLGDAHHLFKLLSAHCEALMTAVRAGRELR